MRRIPGLAGFAVLLTSLATNAIAQTATIGKHVFVTVDAVRVSGGSVSITGILEGESAPVVRTASVAVSSSSYDTRSDVGQGCQRAALMMMERPGAYLFELYVGGPTGSYTQCALIRVAP